MSTSVLRPRFFGAVRGETVKLSRQLSLWLTLAGGAILLGVIVLAISGAQNLKQMLLTDPTLWSYDKLETFGTIFQIGSGIFLLIFGSRLIGMEYSSGTIRILYARGMGRLQLLLAKFLTLAVVGALLFAGYLAIVGAILGLMIVALSGSLDPVHHVSAAFWQDFGRWAIVQGISMGMAILIAGAMAGIGRSLAFAMAASLVVYPVDNFLNILEVLGIRATGHDQPWIAMSQYQLSTNLNVLLNLMEPTHRTREAFAAPLASVDLNHALVVVAVYAVGLAVIAVGRAVRPDVLE
ncbi:MAG TPA: ABC transporter permease [Candidatus Dormibacteraeota bacterium]|nr:ABC transporter permease [Candidatus Dormibacteraeota bacterium]